MPRDGSRDPLGQAAAAAARMTTAGESARHTGGRLPLILIFSGNPLGAGGSGGGYSEMPASVFAQYPRAGSGIFARRHAFARPTSETPNRVATSDTGASQTSRYSTPR